MLLLSVQSTRVRLPPGGSRRTSGPVMLLISGTCSTIMIRLPVRNNDQRPGCRNGEVRARLAAAASGRHGPPRAVLPAYQPRGGAEGLRGSLLVARGVPPVGVEPTLGTLLGGRPLPLGYGGGPNITSAQLPNRGVAKTSSRLFRSPCRLFHKEMQSVTEHMINISAK